MEEDYFKILNNMDNFCSNLFLFIKEIRDGDNSNSSLIGTYCGDPTRTPG